MSFHDDGASHASHGCEEKENLQRHWYQIFIFQGMIRCKATRHASRLLSANQKPMNPYIKFNTPSTVFTIQGQSGESFEASAGCGSFEKLTP